MKVLLIVYKIEKDKGSEDGSGYHFSKHIHDNVSELTIVSRKKNIEKLKDDPNFMNTWLIGIDVPLWLRFFKKKNRGIILYYYLWQIFVGLKIRVLQKTTDFDIIHQINFHASWAPHFIFGKARIVWGPLGQHASIPFDCWYEGTFKFIGELLKRLIKRIFWYCDPFLYWAAKRSAVIYLARRDIHYPYTRFKDKIRFLPYAGSFSSPITTKEISSDFSILFVGRLISLKGCILAMSAIEKFIAELPQEKQRQVEVNFIGNGPLRTKLIQMAAGIQSRSAARVTVHPWLPQAELSQYYSAASLFIFPSFEAQGLVVAEALAFGCLVLCLENSGPHDVAQQSAITVPQGKNQEIINTLALHLSELALEYWYDPAAYRLSADKALARAAQLSWENKVEELMKEYHA